jgi:hypothetical protein
LNANRLTARFTVQAQTVPLVVDLVLFNRGRVNVVLIFLGVGEPLPGSVERSLVSRVAARAKVTS